MIVHCRQANSLLDRCGHVNRAVSKRFHDPLPLKKSKFPLRKTSRSKFLDVKLARLAVRIRELKENKHSTAAELGDGVLYLINKLVQSCRYTAGKLEGESESCHFFSLFQWFISSTSFSSFRS